MHAGQQSGLYRGSESLHRGNCYIPSSQHQRLFTGGWIKDTIHRRKWKRIFDIWWKNNTALNLYWQGLEFQVVFYYFSTTLGRFVWFFHQNPAAQFTLPEGEVAGKGTEKQESVKELFYFLQHWLTDQNPIKKKKNQIQEKALNVSRLLEQMAQEVFPVAIGMYFFLFFIYLFKPL